MSKITEMASTEYASLEEVERAIARLAPAETVRLMKFAEFRARALAGLGVGVAADDLLQDAMASTLDPEGKRWRKSVTFVKHLISAMRNISGHLARDSRDGAIDLVVGDGVDSEMAPEWNHASGTTDAERITIAKDRLARIGKYFAEDHRVQHVLEALALEKTGPEIKTDLGITQNELEAAMLKLRRGAAKVKE